MDLILILKIIIFPILAFISGIRKFVNLCKNCNPSVLELLGVKDEHIIYMNEVGRLIRDNRDKFLSKRCFKTYCGYATAQLRSIGDL